MKIQISEIKIGKRYRKDIGDLTELCESIKKVGLLHPIVLDKDNNLIVGYRRIAAYKQLKFEEIECTKISNLDELLKLQSESDENKCRKDFTPEEAITIGEQLEPIEKEAAKERKSTLNNASVKLTEAKGESLDKVAKAVGMSRNTYVKAKAVIKSGNKQIIEEMNKTGSVDGAFKEIKKEERKQEIQTLKKNIEEGKIELPKGTYEVIVIDPPWRYGDKDDAGYDSEGFRGTTPYPTMSIDDIKKLKIPSSKDCVLWLWTTQKHLRYSFDILDSWGFEDKAVLTWCKNKMGIGKWLRSKSEFCIMAVKGKPTINLTNQTTVLNANIREHSRKPDEFYAMVEELCIGRKLDYFSREKRKGWDTHGIEPNKF